MSDLRIVGGGVYEDARAQVEPTHRALRTSIRPIDKGVFGSYSLGLTSGLVAAAMSGPLPIFEMRWWPSNGVIGLVRRVRLSAAAATLFTAGIATFSLFKATGLSVLDATGAATAPTLLGKSNAKSTRFAPTQLQSNTQAFAILNTANTGLTGGTKTLDNNPLGVISAGVPVTGGTGNTWIVPPGSTLFDSYMTGAEPIELQANEGLVVRAEAIPATGTWTFSADVDWDEVDPARYFA